MFTSFRVYALRAGAFCIICSLRTDAAAVDSMTAIHDSIEVIPGISRDIDSAGIGKNNPVRPISEHPDSTPVATLDKIVVSAGRRQRLLESSQSLSIIRPDEWTGTAMTLADVIAGQPGVQTRKYGGTGSFQTVSIRGVQGGDVLVLLDGIPLNSAMGGAVDLGAINPERLGEIEVYKGIIPGEFGGNAIGGVINLKSKSEEESVGLNGRAGAYGLLAFDMEAGRPLNNRIRLFGTVSHLESDNDWPYLDRNKTPYDAGDDAVHTVENHRHEFFETRLHASADLPGGRTATGGISYSNSETGIPASEGSVNRTAVHRQKLFDVTARLNNHSEPEGAGVVFTPEIGFLRWGSHTFWTGLDLNMGTSHRGITSTPGSWGESKSTLSILHTSCVADVLFSDNLGGRIALTGRYSDIGTKTRVSGFPHGDWPGNSEEASLAIDLNGSLPAGALRLGANAGGAVKAVRSATDGGTNDAFEMKIPSSDTIEYLWSMHGGVQCGINDHFLAFVNAARCSDQPSLRDRYGCNGAVVPNPGLCEETGVTVEAGVRLLCPAFWFEAAVFRTETENGIVMLSDGAMTKPVNLAAGLTRGLEATCRIQPIKFLFSECRLTLQNAVNHSRFNNYYGKKLPGEPDVSVRIKAGVGPLRGVTPEYWFDYRSFFFRDFGNTQRVPETKDSRGMLFHNARIVWQPVRRLDIAVSIINFNGRVFRYEETALSAESGYSWILYPSSEWCVTMKYSF